MTRGNAGEASAWTSATVRTLLKRAEKLERFIQAKIGATFDDFDVGGHKKGEEQGVFTFNANAKELIPASVGCGPATGFSGDDHCWLELQNYLCGNGNRNSGVKGAQSDDGFSGETSSPSKIDFGKTDSSGEGHSASAQKYLCDNGSGDAAADESFSDVCGSEGEGDVSDGEVHDSEADGPSDIEDEERPIYCRAAQPSLWLSDKESHEGLVCEDFDSIDAAAIASFLRGFPRDRRRMSLSITCRDDRTRVATEVRNEQSKAGLDFDEEAKDPAINKLQHSMAKRLSALMAFLDSEAVANWPPNLIQSGIARSKEENNWLDRVCNLAEITARINDFDAFMDDVMVRTRGTLR